MRDWLPETICFDLGSTLWDDRPAIELQWSFLVEILAEHGIETQLETIHEMARQAVQVFAPTLTRVIVWQLVGRREKPYRSIIHSMVERMMPIFNDEAEFRRLNPLLPDAHEVLEQLAREHRLAVVSNNFATADRWMEFHGIHEYFEHVSMSGAYKLHKPDPRLFLAALDALDCAPQDAAMIGDRLDNDIWPANRLGMKSIRIRQGWYAQQLSRYHADEPDRSIDGLSQLLDDAE